MQFEVTLVKNVPFQSKSKLVLLGSKVCVSFCYFFLTELLTSFQTRHDMPCFIAERRRRKLSLQNLDFRCSKSNQNSRTVSITCPSFDVSSF